MKTEEMIKILEEKGYKIEEQEHKFLEVQLSEDKYVLLKNKDGDILVGTWDNMEFLNDFNYLKEYDNGHFWINGEYNKFEFFYKGEWLVCNNRMPVRFLR